MDDLEEVKYKEFRIPIYQVKSETSTIESQLSSESKEQHGQINSVYTLGEDNNHLKAFKEIIQYSVENSQPIFITSFIFNYPTVIDLLIDASQQLEGKIMVLTSFNFNDLRSQFMSYEDERLHNSSIQKMINAGIRIRGFDGAHWKFILAGGNRGLLTSANITSFAFNYNPEFGYTLPFHHTRTLKDWFLHIWRYHTTIERRGKENVPLEPRHKSPCQFESFGSKLKLYWNFGDDKLKSKILESFDYPLESIDIVTYRISDRDIVDKLIEKINSGVTVRLVLPRSIYFDNNRRNIIETLIKNGAQLRYLMETHAKVIILDNQWVWSLTGNLDNYLNDPKNLDVGLLTKVENMVSSAIEFFTILWSRGTSTVTDVFNGQWMDKTKNFDILIDSPEQIHPLIPVNLERVIKNLQNSENCIIYEYNNSNDLLFYNTVRNSKQYRYRFIAEDSKYRISPAPVEELTELQQKGGTIYRCIILNFQWQSFDGNLY